MCYFLRKKREKNDEKYNENERSLEDKKRREKKTMTMKCELL